MISVWDVIETVREAEQAQTAILVRDSRKLARLVAIWPLVQFRRPDALEYVVQPYWENVWKLVDLPVPQVAEMLRCGPGEAGALLRQGIAAHLIYPDGTVHGPAEQVVREWFSEYVKR